ncbi:mucin-2 [Streptomyces sp. NPDC057717]|uniref:mucin-2 n=1 Tax=Streptomyces sp. NPDC057717 TaxID=3346224 RepID=UPI003683DF5F
MSWFKVDDTAHSHPKLRGAGAAAIGLWTLGGSYAAQYLTDGMVHAHFVKTTATAPQLARLVRAGLWHPAGHDCRRCPQPAPGDYLIHDYLVYNPSRAKVTAERERAAEKKRKQRSGGAGETGSDANRSGFARDSETNRDGIEDDSRTKKFGSSDVDAGQSDSSPGDSLGTRARAVTRPDPSVLPEEEQTEKTASYAREPVSIGDRPRIPDASRPLVEKITAQGMVVGWDLSANEWLLIDALIRRCGIDALVVSAAGSWQGAHKQPRSGRYFLPAWRQIPDVPTAAEPNDNTLPAAVGQVLPLNGPHRPATSDLRAQQAIETGRRLQAIADAQNQESQ